jgi:hypothetical protein
MIMQFIPFGIYRKNEEVPPYAIVFQVIVNGEIVETSTTLGDAAKVLHEKLGGYLGK